MGKKYDGYVAGIRAWMERSQSWLERNPDYAAKKRAQLAVLMALTPEEVEALENGSMLTEPQLARIANETGTRSEECRDMYTGFMLFFRKEPPRPQGDEDD